jgi:hypothetical protein
MKSPGASLIPNSYVVRVSVGVCVVSGDFGSPPLSWRRHHG